MKSRARAWEWAIAACGALFVVAVLGWLARDALTREDGPPELVAEVMDVRPGAGGFRVLVRVRNSGGKTAQKAVVEGTLRRGGSVLEASALELDYVPPSSARSGGLVFRNDPRQAELEVRAVSWVEP